MNDRLPYEERDQQFGDLPLPDENASWQRMEKLLDKEDGNDRIIPPVLMRSCLGWGLLLLVGLTAVWLVLRPERWWSDEPQTARTAPAAPEEKGNRPSGKSPLSVPEMKEGETRTSEIVNGTTTRSPVSATTATKPVSRKIATRTTGKHSAEIFNPPSRQPEAISQNEEIIKKPLAKTMDPAIKQEENKPEESRGRDSMRTTITPGQPASAQGDTVKKASEAMPGDSSSLPKAKQKQKKLLLAAGIGEQQQIPIAGQTAVPYSKYGRKGSLADYVPSVFARVQKENKWFLQGEFRFGAAQSVKEFSYNQKTKYDTSSLSITSTTMRLKKTYYHQLPLSFNYYLMPALSIGIGGMYSRFYGAVTEKETTVWNTLTQAASTSKQIIPVRRFTDSFLYKTQVHVLLQADYQWKSLSFGLRYTKDIQPYIKYTRPDGTIDEEKNQSLQFMVRYRLWQSNTL